MGILSGIKHERLIMEKIVILEKQKPKVHIVCFKVNEDEKRFIKEFCDLKDYRLSAAMRVLVLQGINDVLEKENGK